ncbi:alginate export family protein [Thiorhodovibrio frisius]|uniref:Alginate export domain-containing protein n=1 Tax=Thiorhodovibrio frisius TaxID=631362 RepID=H8YXC5_9GAMM|nr:alginate export family protein [Thiorhodovibrio frisius]EIC23101.1 hypothetical protein Thi970DRAFT_00753 [Thiorhodovibrio frisius]WPL22635.1 hypothetical protein Thiofri_02802 [Thiorhodovibrio frisius]
MIFNPRQSGLLAATLLSTAALAAPEQASSPFDWGADMRLRQIYIGNVGLNDDTATADRNFERLRLRLWGNYKPNDQFGLNSRLIWEGRHYVQPDEDTYPLPGFQDWYSGGILFDQLNVDLKPIATLPLTFKIGRQDLIFGNGWLILEGTPIDGSRTIYFDAARATYQLEALDTTVDLIYIDQDANTGRFPQPLNGVIEDQTEQYETGAILYLRNKSMLKDGAVDGYFIYKHSRENLTDYVPGLDTVRENNGAPFPSPSDTGDVYGIGARVDTKLTDKWSLRAETIYEWGTRNNADLSAFGFNSRIGYFIGGPLEQSVHFDYEYLSGDDPNSSTNQAFDPLWSRWPQWSELMVYQWPLESRVAEATNLQRLNLGWGAKPHETTTVTLNYHALFANENSTRTASQLANITDNGKFRGHLFTGWIKTKLNKHLSGHLVAEYLLPGDYYAKDRRDNSYFVRAEINLAW